MTPPDSPRPTPLEPTVAAGIEFHTAGYFHPSAVVCSAKEAERVARDLSEAREKLEEALKSPEWGTVWMRRALAAEQKLERRDSLLMDIAETVAPRDGEDEMLRSYMVINVRRIFEAEHEASGYVPGQKELGE